jgi:hypothetical protein
MLQAASALLKAGKRRPRRSLHSSGIGWHWQRRRQHRGACRHPAQSARRHGGSGSGPITKPVRAPRPGPGPPLLTLPAAARCASAGRWRWQERGVIGEQPPRLLAAVLVVPVTVRWQWQYLPVLLWCRCRVSSCSLQSRTEFNSHLDQNAAGKRSSIFHSNERADAHSVILLLARGKKRPGPKVAASTSMTGNGSSSGSRRRELSALQCNVDQDQRALRRKYTEGH